MKTKRGLAVGGGTALCAALAVLIAAQFKPAEQLTTSAPEVSSAPSVSVKISTPNHEETKPVEIQQPEVSTSVKPDDNAANGTPVEIDPDKESENFIEDGGIEIEQNFPEPEKVTEPPAPPVIEDEEMLTNPDTEPTYTPEQTTVTKQKTPADSTNPNINPAMHGQKKDGKIFINGFGWVVDEGGGGIGEAAPEMYENGNKIGYFG
ncbi:MAG: hypothetical protein NC299_16560 [Lachnospiraceae bacterium]|nr:hypothetical protein [Lachnospiraceae bacterium]